MEKKKKSCVDNCKRSCVYSFHNSHTVKIPTETPVQLQFVADSGSNKSAVALMKLKVAPPPTKDTDIYKVHSTVVVPLSNRAVFTQAACDVNERKYQVLTNAGTFQVFCPAVNICLCTKTISHSASSSAKVQTHFNSLDCISTPSFDHLLLASAQSQMRFFMESCQEFGKQTWYFTSCLVGQVS